MTMKFLSKRSKPRQVEETRVSMETGSSEENLEKLPDEATETGSQKKESSTANDCWEEVLDVGGETVYAFLQFQKVFPEGWVIAIATVCFQMFCFFVFFMEAYRCGILESDDCTLSGGILENVNGTTQLSQNQQVTDIGIGMGITVAAAFLLPDFFKGFVFFRKGYFLIGLVHVFISIFALTTSALYAATTAVSDVSILTNVVVLLFITDFDEKMFEIHSSGRKFLLNKGYI